jgi:hypothetical protein
MFGFTLQLVFGLLMLSATAPTALAEERVRGSLDVLLATPLSTRSIVVGMWWGAYRIVFILMLMPLFVGVLLAAASPDLPTLPGASRLYPRLVPLTTLDRLLSVTLCTADFLASSALIVSLGLALATWVRRLGRAVALSVIAYFLLGIGWIFFFELLVLGALRQTGWMQDNLQWLSVTVTSFSPIGGPINPISSLEQFAYSSRKPQWIGQGVVLTIKMVVAWLVFLLTVKTFDRCVGRVSESRAPARSR